MNEVTSIRPVAYGTCRHLPSYQRRHHRARVVARGLVGLAREVDVPYGAEAGARGDRDVGMV